MSSTLQEICSRSKEALTLYDHKSFEECTAHLNMIREKLMDVDRSQLDADVIQNLCGIIKGETRKWTEEIYPTLSGFEVATQAFFCLRNSFVNCSQTQLRVAETEDYRNDIVSTLKWVFTSKPEKHRLKEKGGDEFEDEWLSKNLRFAKATVTCVGNLVAANASTRRIMWPHLLPLLRPMLQYSDESVSYLSCMVIFNCLLEEELKNDLLRCINVNDIICDMMTLYINGDSTAERAICFVLYCLELLLCTGNEFSGVWSSLSGKQQILALDIMSNVFEGKASTKCGTLPSSSGNFLVNTFKDKADAILRTYSSEKQDDMAMVVAKLLTFTCMLAASDRWGPVLREDRSLLITTVSLLQCMNDMGSIEGSEFSRMGLAESINNEQRFDAESHPAYGFKRDLITLIASLVFRNQANQDEVRRLGGITSILESSQYDARNPGIKEASIYAIRNLLEGNSENQQVVKDLNYVGEAKNQEMQLSRVDGMMVVHGSSSSAGDEDS